MRLITLTAASLLIYLNSLAKPSNEMISKINFRYVEIQKNYKKQVYTIKKISDEQLADLKVTAYYKNDKLELIVSENYGDAGKIRHEYYFDKNGELILASNQLFNYQDKKLGTLTKVNENRFFYQQKTLVKWLENGKYVRISQPDAKSRSRYMIGMSKMLTQQLKQKQDDEIISKYQQNSYTAKLSGGEYAQPDKSSK